MKVTIYVHLQSMAAPLGMDGSVKFEEWLNRHFWPQVKAHLAETNPNLVLNWQTVDASDKQVIEFHSEEPAGKIEEVSEVIEYVYAELRPNDLVTAAITRQH